MDNQINELIEKIKTNYKEAEAFEIKGASALATSIRNMLEQITFLFYKKMYDETYAIYYNQLVKNEKFKSVMGNFVSSDMVNCRECCNKIIHQNEDVNFEDLKELFETAESCVCKIQKKLDIKILPQKYEDVEINAPKDNQGEKNMGEFTKKLTQKLDENGVEYKIEYDENCPEAEIVKIYYNDKMYQAEVFAKANVVIFEEKSYKTAEETIDEIISRIGNLHMDNYSNHSNYISYGMEWRGENQTDVINQVLGTNYKAWMKSGVPMKKFGLPNVISWFTYLNGNMHGPSDNYLWKNYLSKDEEIIQEKYVGNDVHFVEERYKGEKKLHRYRLVFQRDPENRGEQYRYRFLGWYKLESVDFNTGVHIFKRVQKDGYLTDNPF